MRRPDGTPASDARGQPRCPSRAQGALPDEPFLLGVLPVSLGRSPPEPSRAARSPSGRPTSPATFPARRSSTSLSRWTRATSPPSRSPDPSWSLTLLPPTGGSATSTSRRAERRTRRTPRRSASERFRRSSRTPTRAFFWPTATRRGWAVGRRGPSPRSAHRGCGRHRSPPASRTTSSPPSPPLSARPQRCVSGMKCGGPGTARLAVDRRVDRRWQLGDTPRLTRWGGA